MKEGARTWETITQWVLDCEVFFSHVTNLWKGFKFGSFLDPSPIYEWCERFPSTCPPPNWKPFGPSKVSRWVVWDQCVWTKTSFVWRKRREISFFLNARQNKHTKPIGISKYINQHSRRLQALNKWIITPSA